VAADTAVQVSFNTQVALVLDITLDDKVARKNGRCLAFG
jgi:hypothetical protein